MPGFADQGDHIRLKAAWTKGGKTRVVPILRQDQRTVLDRAHRLAGNGSLIPSQKKLHPAVESLRAPYHTSGTVEAAWPAPCLRPVTF